METVCQNMRDLLKKIEMSPTLKEADKENEKLMVKNKLFLFLPFFSFECLFDNVCLLFCNNYLFVGDSVTQIR